jgi:hypothetical protein
VAFVFALRQQEEEGLLRGQGMGGRTWWGRDESRAKPGTAGSITYFWPGVESAKQTLRLFDRLPYSV